MRRIEDEDGNPWHKDDKRVMHLNTGVKGVHCCMPFQCKVCWIGNLEGRLPNRLDTALVMHLRRANLDAFAGKSRKTIDGHRGRNAKIVANAMRVNKTPSLCPRGPFPLKDNAGVGLAVEILQESLMAVGRNEPTVQAETLRKLRSTFAKS